MSRTNPLTPLWGLHCLPAEGERPLQIMEICGTHTMSIAKAGIRQLLPPGIKLISGPGCPVCVTPAGALDEALRFSLLSDTVIATYGDLVRVPGSRQGDTLAARRAQGAQVKICYSPLDAVDFAAVHPEKQVIFLGVGFETTAPGTAACILTAKEQNLKNFSVLSLLKTTEPAMRTLLENPENHIDALLCPGHVAAIVGADAFAFLPREYHRPAVVAGFESGDIAAALLELGEMLESGTPALKNRYSRVVRPQGNPAALAVMRQVFEPCDSHWRGLGCIPQSGLSIREEYAEFDAARRFGFAPGENASNSGCRCGDVLQGRLNPWDCPLFGKLCTPVNPVGPCMVSGEGACTAAMRYRGSNI